MDFDSFLAQAWDGHATEPAAVAERLAATGPGLVTSDAQLAALAHLVHHVWGEHLGRWSEGRALLHQLAAHPCREAEGAARGALERLQASLALCEGVDERAAMAPPDRIRVSALAAANLAERDTARASALFGEALAEADRAGLDAADPTNRTLAVTANNLACTLEETAARTAEARALMIAAAQAARRFWALAGTWLETERAEYRLAMTWLQAGNPALARHHAQQCLAIVQANGSAPLERFFAWEAIGLTARAGGDAASHDEALEHARTAFAALDEGDQGWCRASLDKLAG
jgi:hypothetical protein